MLMRTDPFCELDRLTQRFMGAVARPAAVLIDAYRDQDLFVVHFAPQPPGGVGDRYGAVGRS